MSSGVFFGAAAAADDIVEEKRGEELLGVAWVGLLCGFLKLGPPPPTMMCPRVQVEFG